MNEAGLLIVCGIALLVLALAIIVKQKRAASCKAHDPRAGVMAMVLAAACLIGGIVLLQIGLVG